MTPAGDQPVDRVVADMFAALRWPDQTVVTPDIPIPTGPDDLRSGFLFDPVTHEILAAQTSATRYRTTREPGFTTEPWGAYGHALYSTRRLALQALRREVEWQAAQHLLTIDHEIAAEADRELFGATQQDSDPR